MNKLVRSLFAGATIAMPLNLLITSPAAAASADAAVIQGHGTISPGLTPVPTQQSISFTGTATVVGTDGVLATYPCSFTGTDLAGSLAAGVGTVKGNCGPLDFTTCVFVRIGAEVQVICADTGVSVGAAVCVFQPDQINPTTSYTLTCGAVAAEAP
jgi:hypothetical protein